MALAVAVVDGHVLRPRGLVVDQLGSACACGVVTACDCQHGPLAEAADGAVARHVEPLALHNIADNAGARRAAKRIGRSIALRLAAEGARVGYLPQEPKLNVLTYNPNNWFEGARYVSTGYWREWENSIMRGDATSTTFSPKQKEIVNQRLSDAIGCP